MACPVRSPHAPAGGQEIIQLYANAYLRETMRLTFYVLDSGLDFTVQALRHNLDKETELSVSFREAYGNTLKPHHSFVVKPIFSAAMSATPYRKDFYEKLGSDPAKVNAALTREVEALERIVAILNQFLSSKEAKW